MSLKAKLSRMKKHLGSETTEKEVKPYVIETPSLDVPFLSKWEELDAKPFFLEDNYSIIREKSYPIDHVHGKYAFSELHSIQEKWQKLKASHPLSSSDISVSEMVFFDTETTGLSGGAGNYIFLLGYAKVLENEVIVKQHFLPNPGAEVPLYYGFLTDIGESINLLTSFNGKSFDWPQVKTRHTFVRNEVPNLPKFAHFDLLHGSRRLWKEILPSCKLSVVENEVISFKRENDTPGYLAPMLYFDFLSEQNPEYVEGVIQHNEWDVLSLISLYVHISSCILEMNSNLTTIEQFEIGRWFEQVGEIALAKRYYLQVSNQLGTKQVPALMQLGVLSKKEQQYDDAIRYFEMVIDIKDYGIEALIELSKIYEHQKKDYEKALYYAYLASEVFESKAIIVKKLDKEEETLQKRIERLERKSK
ncbi:ribonuclease H-like domain-containing protein [Bacillus sp. FJAT-45350]|uniref:ribonuclease H-like domain-containing protein n=1 Tax=Bacillus sp. FJAT-45350 TaxID=2011014 RepID=UPI000BB8579A|nr:ribonuclease H-like domain-containing protein [Bacillus sp. FJAT-45350]